MLGVVQENKNLTHVVVRVDVAALGYSFSEVELQTASRNGEEWRLNLPEKVEVLKRAFDRGRRESNQSLKSEPP